MQISREQWPSLFMGPKVFFSACKFQCSVTSFVIWCLVQNSSCGLHTDSIGSHFWMAMLKGRKRWHIFRKDDAAFLAPNHLRGTFGVDSFADASLQPRGYNTAQVYSHDLVPGKNSIAALVKYSDFRFTRRTHLYPSWVRTP